MITVKPTTLPEGTVGHFYSKTMTASGGVGPYTFIVLNGTLPNGLTLSSNGVLSGTPTTEGIFSFTIQATDTRGCTGKRQYTISVKCQAITLRPTSLPAGTIGHFYSKTFTVHGGNEPITYSIETGTLPDGLTLSPDGVLSGIPTVEGFFTFTVLATDNFGCTGKRQYSIDVKCPNITISPSSLPRGTVNRPYSRNITASGGNSPYSFVVESGNLPNGLTLSSSGLLAGTPTNAGTFTFTIAAKDIYSCDGKRQYTLSIAQTGTAPTRPEPPLTR